MSKAADNEFFAVFELRLFFCLLILDGSLLCLPHALSWHIASSPKHLARRLVLKLVLFWRLHATRQKRCYDVSKLSAIPHASCAPFTTTTCRNKLGWASPFSTLACQATPMHRTRNRGCEKKRLQETSRTLHPRNVKKAFKHFHSPALPESFLPESFLLFLFPSVIPSFPPPFLPSSLPSFFQRTLQVKLFG